MYNIYIYYKPVMFQRFLELYMYIRKSSEPYALAVMTHVSTTMSFPNLPSRLYTHYAHRAYDVIV